MLEIIAIFSLGKHIRQITQDKGLKPLKYVLLMIAMWIGFEIIGAVVGAIIFGQGLLVYLMAVGGAALGGYLSYRIAQNAEPLEPTMD